MATDHAADRPIARRDLEPGCGLAVVERDPQAVAAPAGPQDRLPGIGGVQVARQQASHLAAGLAAAQGLRGAAHALA
jgi:hypothetical protein